MKNRSIRIQVILISVLLLLLAACHSKKGAEDAPHWFEKYTFFSEANYVNHLTSQINALTDKQCAFSAQVRNFYQQRQYVPLWTLEGFQPHTVDSMVTLLGNATHHGLNPDMFGYGRICQRIDSLKAYKYDNESSLYGSLAALETDLTNAYILYTNALRFGVTNPEVVNGGKWLYKWKGVDTNAVKQALQATDTLFSFIHFAQPLDSHYVAMTREMARLWPMKDTTFKQIPVVTLDSGAVHKAVRLIGQRLQLTGELSARYICNDTLGKKLLAAVNLFRSNNAIPESNAIDEETVKALNRPISYYTDKLRVNLERARWKVLPAKGPDCIVVNVPDFTLKAARNGQIVANMRICCGKTLARKDSVAARTDGGIIQSYKAETPMIYGEIDQVVLNPEWFVPESITKDEYYKKLCSNAKALLSKEHFYVYSRKTGKQVLADTIEWKKINRNRIPYMLIQSSGRHNSLGRIKLNFPNTEYVYLHDTPSKGAFNKRNRAVSHGCVRVENPVDLAMVVFDYNEYDDEQLEQVRIQLGEPAKTRKGKEFIKKRDEEEEEYYNNLPDDEKKFYRKLRPTYVEMEKKMPVYFEYFTCFLGTNGMIQYRDDVYLKEQNVLHELKAAEKK